MAEPLITVKGEMGEGGGHIVRTALSLSALTRRPVQIDNIRTNRRLPGLRHEHLVIARAVAAVTGGRLEGDNVGSHSLRFYPGLAMPGVYEFTFDGDATESGSVSNLLYAIAPALFFSGGRSEITITGITHGPKGPSSTYTQTVFLQTIMKFGYRAEATTYGWGWSPGGGGILQAHIEPVIAPRAVDLTERGELIQIGGVAACNELEDGFGLRLKNRVLRRLNEMGRTAQIQIKDDVGNRSGGMIFLLAVFERSTAGFSGVYEPGHTAEEVADLAVDELFHFLTSYSVIDKHLSNQILLYAALCDGEVTFSCSELTPTTLTTAELIRQFLPVSFKIDGRPGGPADLTVHGRGLRR